jgi:hypothetical protein
MQKGFMAYFVLFGKSLSPQTIVYVATRFKTLILLFSHVTHWFAFCVKIQLSKQHTEDQSLMEIICFRCNVFFSPPYSPGTDDVTEQGSWWVRGSDEGAVCSAVCGTDSTRLQRLSPQLLVPCVNPVLGLLHTPIHH